MTTYGAVLLAVKRQIAEGEPFTIRRIHEITGYAKESVETAIRRLEREEYVVKLARQEKGNVGRPQDWYQLTPDKQKRQQFIDGLLPFAIDIPPSEVPTGGRYPLLVIEINKLASDINSDPDSERVEALLDNLWDAYLEEGEEDASESVKMYLHFQSVRLRALGFQLNDDQIAKELNLLQNFFSEHKQLDMVQEIEDFRRIIEIRRICQTNQKNDLSSQVDLLLPIVQERLRKTPTLLWHIFLHFSNQVYQSYKKLLEKTANLQNGINQLNSERDKLKRELDNLIETLSYWRDRFHLIQSKLYQMQRERDRWRQRAHDLEKQLITETQSVHLGPILAMATPFRDFLTARHLKVYEFKEEDEEKEEQIIQTIFIHQTDPWTVSPNINQSVKEKDYSVELFQDPASPIPAQEIKHRLYPTSPSRSRE